MAPKVLFKVLFIQLADETNSNSFGTKPVKYYTITTLVHQHLAPPLFQMMTYTNPDWLTPTHFSEFFNEPIEFLHLRTPTRL